MKQKKCISIKFSIFAVVTLALLVSCSKQDSAGGNKSKEVQKKEQSAHISGKRSNSHQDQDNRAEISGQKGMRTRQKPSEEERMKRLQEMLKSDDSDTRFKAEMELSDIEFRKELQQMQAEMAGKDEKTIAELRIQMRAMEMAHNVDRLLFTMKSRDSRTVTKAAERLKRITGEDFGGDYNKWKEWWDANKDKMIDTWIKNRK